MQYTCTHTHKHDTIHLRVVGVCVCVCVQPIIILLYAYRLIPTYVGTLLLRISLSSRCQTTRFCTECRYLPLISCSVKVAYYEARNELMEFYCI